MKKTLFIASVVCGAVLLATSTALAVSMSGYSEGWDSGDLAGWVANTTQTTVNVVNTGGNPDGYLYSKGNNMTGTWDIGALSTLPEVTGDYSGTIWQASFDLLFISGSFDDAWLRFRYQDSTYNGWRYDLTDSFLLGEWTSFSVTFDPAWSDSEAMAAGWEQESLPSVSWGQTMSDVYTTEIRISGEGFLEAGIDNYRLEVIPEPGTLILMGVGLLGLVALRRKYKQSR